MIQLDSLSYVGNIKILKKYKIVFLCSRTCPAHIILKAYDWACEQRDKGNCIISGFHSQIEKDVFHFLLKGKQPIILVLARGLKKRWGLDIKKALSDNRLLIITPFEESVKRVTSDTALKRNAFMAQIANEIFVAHATPGGNVEKLILKYLQKRKPIMTFAEKENRHLIKEGISIYP